MEQSVWVDAASPPLRHSPGVGGGLTVVGGQSRGRELLSSLMASRKGCWHSRAWAVGIVVLVPHEFSEPTTRTPSRRHAPLTKSVLRSVRVMGYG